MEFSFMNHFNNNENSNENNNENNNENSNENNNENSNENNDLSFNIDTNFKLPIQYLDNNSQYALDENLLYDLELKTPSNYNIDKTMYHYMFNPSNEFANYTMYLWEKQITNDVNYLNDTKTIISKMGTYDNSQCNYSLDCDKFKNVWKSIKLDNRFLEKYNFMDWEMLKSCNESSSFLQILSFIHVISPIISFVLPVLFLIFPFIILKVQGVPIDVNTYVTTLKGIAQNHFIGKAIAGFQSISWDKLVYIMFLLGMYVFQIYQNIILCKRFYNNSIIMNNNLMELKNYVNYTIKSFESFHSISHPCKSYSMFNHINNEQLQTLYEMQNELIDIYPVEFNLQKFNNMGYMLRCYYQFHSNTKFENCLRYSVGFHGYIDNLQGIHNNIQNGVSLPNGFTNNVTLVPYGYVFTNKDAIVDFLVSYGAFLESRGMVFGTTENTNTLDWGMMAQEFLKWASQGWGTGSIVNLNPGAISLEFNKELSIKISSRDFSYEKCLLDVYPQGRKKEFYFNKKKTFKIKKFNKKKSIKLRLSVANNIKSAGFRLYNCRDMDGDGLFFESE